MDSFQKHREEIKKKQNNKIIQIEDLENRLKSTNKKLTKIQDKYDKAVGLSDTELVNELFDERLKTKNLVESLHRNIKKAKNELKFLKNDASDEAKLKDIKSKKRYLITQLNQLSEKLIPKFDELKTDFSKLVDYHQKLNDINHSREFTRLGSLKIKDGLNYKFNLESNILKNLQNGEIILNKKNSN